MEGTMNVKGFCPICEEITRIRKEEKIAKVKVRNKIIEVEEKFYVCQSCDGEFEDPLDESDPIEEAYKKYRKLYDLLKPEEIKGLRKKYGLTQKQFSKVAGVGEITLSRYENGALQDVAHNVILELLLNPENMLKRVVELKKIFSTKKYDEIVEKLKKEKLSNSIIQHQEGYFGLRKPDLNNGYRNIDPVKATNTILYFCRNGVGKTKLNKLMYYFDFKCFKELGMSATGLEYAKINYGPVPNNFQSIYAILIDDEKAIEPKEVNYGDGIVGEIFKSTRKPCLDLFSKEEMKILKEIDRYFESFSARKIVDFSHEEEGYKKTIHCDLISYKYAKKLQI